MGKDSAEGVVGGVCFDNSLSIRVEMLNRRAGEELNELFLGFSYLGCRFPVFWIQAGGICQREADLTIVFNESLVEVRETEKALDLLKRVDWLDAFKRFDLLMISSCFSFVDACIIRSSMKATVPWSNKSRKIWLIIA